MTITKKCLCLHEQPQGIRPGPNAKTRLEADRKCRLCGGEGTLTVRTTHEAGQPREIAVYEAWRAVAIGAEDITGYGGTKAEAVADLMIRMVEASN